MGSYTDVVVRTTKSPLVDLAIAEIRANPEYQKELAGYYDIDNNFVFKQGKAVEIGESVKFYSGYTFTNLILEFWRKLVELDNKYNEHYLILDNNLGFNAAFLQVHEDKEFQEEFINEGWELAEIDVGALIH